MGPGCPTGLWVRSPLNHQVLRQFSNRTRGIKTRVWNNQHCLPVLRFIQCHDWTIFVRDSLWSQKHLTQESYVAFLWILLLLAVSTLEKKIIKNGWVVSSRLYTTSKRTMCFNDREGPSRIEKSNEKNRLKCFISKNGRPW